LTKEQANKEYQETNEYKGLVEQSLEAAKMAKVNDEEIEDIMAFNDNFNKDIYKTRMSLDGEKDFVER